jgi:hypothetical protein
MDALEDEDDDYYEHDLPHEWRPKDVVRIGTVDPQAVPKQRSPLSGHLPYPTNPGLKPWAVLSDPPRRVKTRLSDISHAKLKGPAVSSKQ